MGTTTPLLEAYVVRWDDADMYAFQFEAATGGAGEGETEAYLADFYAMLDTVEYE